MTWWNKSSFACFETQKNVAFRKKKKDADVTVLVYSKFLTKFCKGYAKVEIQEIIYEAQFGRLPVPLQRRNTIYNPSHAL